MHWDDLKIFLALSRHGSLSAAARNLGVNQTTISRRLARLEAEAGFKLTHRTGTRLTLSPEGLEFAQEANAVEEAILKLESQTGHKQKPGGSVKITAVESLINGILLPRLPAFRNQYPDIELTLHGSNSNLEIRRLEADIGIRLARPTHGNMIMVKLGDIGFALYGTSTMKRYSEKHGLQNSNWAAYDDSLEDVPEMQWIRHSYPDAPVMTRSHSAATLATILGQGQSIGLLPCFLGDQQEDLYRLSGSHPVLFREAWLVSHPDRQETPRLKAAVSWIRSSFRQKQNSLSGSLPEANQTV